MDTHAPTSPTVYPSPISRACSALDESPVFTELPDGYFRVILRLIKKIDLRKLTSPIVASRSTLAKESGKSVETVHRAIKWLEDRSLVQRDQKARPGLRGSSSPLVPTQKLLDALLLSDTAYQFKSRSVDQTAHISPHPSQALRQPFVTIDKVKVPSDLAWLVHQQGMMPYGILHLMKLANLSKKRLSDIVTCTRTYLLPLKGRQVFAYLRTLIHKDKDFSFHLREQLQATQQQDQLEYLKQKADALSGRAFRSRDGLLEVFVDPSGLLIEHRSGIRSARQISTAFLDAVHAGRLISIQ